MKDVISKAVALGIGLGITGKEKAEQVAKEAQKKLGLTQKESTAFVNSMIKKGEVVRKDLEKQVNSIVKEAVDRLIPVSRKEFDDLKASMASKKKAKKR